MKTLADLQKEWRGNPGNVPYDDWHGGRQSAFQECAEAINSFVTREAKDYELIMALKNELYSYCAHPHWNKDLMAKARARLDT